MIELFVKVATSIVVIIIAARLIGNLMPYIKQPRVIGEMIAGVLLGPTLLGRLFPEISLTVFPEDIMPFLFIISNIGLSIYMFTVGMEMDINIFNKKTIKQSGVMSLTAIIFPFIAAYLVVQLYFDSLAGTSPGNLTSFTIFMGTAFAITAFPMLARVLEEKQIAKSKLGGVMLLSASVQDVFSWIMLSFVTSIVTGGKLINGVYTFVGCFVFVAIVKFLVKPLLNKFSESTTENKELTQSNFAWIIVILLSCAIITDKIGLYSVFGGFILGFFIPRNKTLIDGIKVRLYDTMVVFFLPIFFAYSGLKTDLAQLVSSTYILPCVVIIVISMASKFVPVLLVMKLSGFSWRTSTAMGGLLNARGLMELIIANIGLSYGVINSPTYSILVLLAILSTLGATPIYELATKNGKHKLE